MNHAEFTASDIAPSSVNHPDFEMEVYLMIGDDNQIYVLHDRPFHKNLSWVEYVRATERVDFIMEDGDARDFGIPVEPRFAQYLNRMNRIAVVEIDNGKYKDGNNYPLIIHEGRE